MHALRFLCLGLVLLTGACASRPEVGALTPLVGADRSARRHTILVATTRAPDERPGTLFGGERSPSLGFAEVTIGIPPTHRAGEIEWPSTPPGNPETDFVTLAADRLAGEAAFAARLKAELAKRPKDKRRILLFVHGYNTKFAEGLHRFAQIVDDSRADAVPVFFTWASRGKLADYVYDGNSATAARDALERTFRLLAASGADEVDVLAHSMGTWVTMEAIRQVRMTGGVSADKVGSIILASPDIDVDVFKSQMKRIGKPRRPFVVVSSKDDKALALSSFIAGDKQRLGAYESDAELVNLGIVVVDLTELEGSDAANHGKFAEIAAIAPQLREALAKDALRRDPSDAPDTISRGAAGIVALPLDILGAPVRILSGGR